MKSIKKDLKDLKKLVRENLSREEYQRLFAKKDEKANYYAYIKAPKQCSQEDFYGYLKKNTGQDIRCDESILYAEGNGNGNVSSETDCKRQQCHSISDSFI